MANITDQFVTSFSELYYSTARITASDQSNPSELEVKSWFENSGTGSTQKISTILVAGTIVSGTDYSVTLDGITFTFTAASTSATDVAAGLRSLINGVGRFTTGTASTATITVTGVGLGDYLVVVPSAFTAAVTTQFLADTGTKLIPLVMEIGTLSNEATVIDTPTFGDVYRGKLRGQLDGGQLDAQLYWAPRNAIHKELRELSETGVPVYVGIKWNSDSTATNSEYVYFDSFVSSFGIDTTFDDVAKVSMTLVVDGAEHFASDE